MNIIGLEDYLAGVLSSGGTAVEGLKEQAVKVRAWAVQAMKEREESHLRAATMVDGISGTPSLVTWLDTTGTTEAPRKEEGHSAFDVCADDHCRPYRGILGTDALQVRMAVDDTWGETQ